METSIFILKEQFVLYKGSAPVDTLFLFDTKDGRILRLNKVSFSIIELFDGKRTVAEILEKLRSRFKVDTKVLRNDVFSLISSLQEKDIIIERR